MIKTAAFNYFQFFFIPKVLYTVNVFYKGEEM